MLKVCACVYLCACMPSCTYVLVHICVHAWVHVWVCDINDDGKYVCKFQMSASEERKSTQTNWTSNQDRDFVLCSSCLVLSICIIVCNSGKHSRFIFYWPCKCYSFFKKRDVMLWSSSKLHAQCTFFRGSNSCPDLSLELFPFSLVALASVASDD